MSFHSTATVPESPESSSEDLQTASLAKYLQETGNSLQQEYTSTLSTATTVSHQATESSGIQHSYYAAGYPTDPTSSSSVQGSDKQFPSHQAEYGSSTGPTPASGSRKNSDPTEELPTLPVADGFGQIGSHLEYGGEIEEFHHPVNEQEAQAIVLRVAHTTAGMDEALINGPRQVNNPGLPYRLSAQPQISTELIGDDPDGGISIVAPQEVSRVNEDRQPEGSAQARPGTIEKASKMRICCWCITW